MAEKAVTETPEITQSVDKSKEDNKVKKKTKWEWSKFFAVIIAIVFGGYGIYCGIEYYAMCKYAIEMGHYALPSDSLAVTCVNTVLGSLIGYCGYQGALKVSLNKNGLCMKNGVVTRIDDAVNNDVEEKSASTAK